MSQITEENEKQKTSKMSLKRVGIIVLLNLIAILILSGVIIWLLQIWAASYTRHNDIVQVPDLVGITQSEAEELLASQDLFLSVSDSVYNENATPGEILESVPRSGATIKRERTIYVTINAYQVMQKPVPKVHEVSRRQVEAMLKAIGFTNVSIQLVPGSYDDLVQHLKTKEGRSLEPGERIPYNTPLILEVSTSDPSAFLNDSIESGTPPIDKGGLEEDLKEEEWF